LLSAVLFIRQYYYPPLSNTKVISVADSTAETINGVQGIKENSKVLQDSGKPALKPDLSITLAEQKKEPEIKQNPAILIPSVKKTGSLFVECLPWAYIYIDSAKTDITPLKNSLILSEGEHFIQLIHPNYPVYSQKIRISENGHTNIKINLDTLFAYLDCKVNPWCEILMDGKSRGETPLQSPLRITPGKHHILLKNSEYAPVEYDIKIAQGETYTIRYNFKKTIN
jgi:hypothetical protein